MEELSGRMGSGPVLVLLSFHHYGIPQADPPCLILYLHVNNYTSSSADRGSVNADHGSVNISGLNTNLSFPGQD